MIPSDADLQRYLRIVIYYGAGFATAHGWVTDAWSVTISGIVISLITFAWSIYGMRIRAKLKEMSELAQDPSSPVKGVILTKDEKGTELAAAIPGPVITEGTAQARKLAA